MLNKKELVSQLVVIITKFITETLNERMGIITKKSHTVNSWYIKHVVSVNSLLKHANIIQYDISNRNS